MTGCRAEMANSAAILSSSPLNNSWALTHTVLPGLLKMEGMSLMVLLLTLL